MLLIKYNITLLQLRVETSYYIIGIPTILLCIYEKHWCAKTRIKLTIEIESKLHWNSTHIYKWVKNKCWIILIFWFQVPPSIIDKETSTDMVVREANNATLICKAAGYPEPYVMWRREDGDDINYNGDTGRNEIQYNNNNNRYL